MTLADWLRKVKPALVVAGERTWPTPVGARKWETLADLCGDAEEVLAYTETNGLLGAWRKPTGMSPGTTGQSAELFSMMRDAMAMQSSILKEVITTQTALMRSIREAAEATAAFRVRIPAPTEGEEGDEGEGGMLDGAVADMLQQAMAKGFKVGGTPPPADGESK